MDTGITERIAPILEEVLYAMLIRVHKDELAQSAGTEELSEHPGRGY